MSIKEVQAYKMVIVPSNFPEKISTENQAHAIQEIIVGEVLSFDEEEIAPKFHNSCLEKGALLITSVDETGKKWLEDKVPKINVKERLQLKLDLARVGLRSMNVLVWVPKPLGKHHQNKFCG